MKRLLPLVFALCAGMVFAAEQPVAAPNMKRAHRVEFESVKTKAENVVSMVALLTYTDGSKARCSYVAHWKIRKTGDKTGIEYLPDSESCTPIE